MHTPTVSGNQGVTSQHARQHEELWTVPKFSVNPGFNDDFHRLLGSVLPEAHHPIPPPNISESLSMFASGVSGAHNGGSQPVAPAAPQEEQTDMKPMHQPPPPPPPAHAIPRVEQSASQPLPHPPTDSVPPPVLDNNGGFRSYLPYDPSLSSQQQQLPLQQQPQQQHDQQRQEHPQEQQGQHPQEQLQPQQAHHHYNQFHEKSTPLDEPDLSPIPVEKTFGLGDVSIDQHERHQENGAQVVRHQQPNLQHLHHQNVLEHLHHQQQDPEREQGHSQEQGPEQPEGERRTHLIETGRAALEEWRNNRPLPAGQNTSARSDTAARLEEERRKHEDIVSKLTADIQDLSEALRKQARQHTEEVSSLQLQCQQQQQPPQDYLNQLTSLQNSLKASELRVVEAENLLEHKSGVATSLAVEVANLKEQLTGPQKPDADISLRLEEVSAEKVKAEHEANKWQVLYQELYDKNQELDRRMQNQRQEMESELNLHYENEVSLLNLRVSELEAQVGKEKDVSNLLRQEKESLETELQHSRDVTYSNANTSAGEGDITMLSQQLKALNSENERLAEKLQEREAVGATEVDQLVTERDDLRQKLAALMNGEEGGRLQHLEMQVLKLSSELAAKQQHQQDLLHQPGVHVTEEAAPTDMREAIRIRRMEEEWDNERQRHIVFQGRLQGENEQQRAQLQELEEQLSELRQQLHEQQQQQQQQQPRQQQPMYSPDASSASPSPPAASSSAPPPAPAFYTEVVEVSDPAGGTMSLEVRRPVPTLVPASPLTPALDPSQPSVALGSSEPLVCEPRSLPLSVLIFDTIFSLGGFLPSTRHKFSSVTAAV